MSNQSEITLLSKILQLNKSKDYEDIDEFSLKLSRIFLESKRKQEFLKKTKNVRTSFFRKNKVIKNIFLEEIFSRLSKVKLPKQDKGMFPKRIYIEDFEQFEKVKGVTSSVEHLNILEIDVEELFQNISGEPYKHTHSGVENSDCLSTRYKLNGKRISVAIAFNGRSKIRSKNKGLTPADCGTNGDQIIRLFNEPAEVFILQAVGRIHNSTYSEMRAHASKASEGGKKEVYYCIIDGNDTDRIFKAYPSTE